MNKQLILCTCCKAELTCPQFHNGNPYGWTCIKKVDPAFKQDKVVYVACEAFKVVDGEGSAREVVWFKVNGKAFKMPFYGRQGMYVQDGVMFVAEPKIK